jgi:mRNA interferase MazF
VIWVNFDPQVGREQSGHRPAVVLSEIDYNRRVGLCVCVPTTTRIKAFPFEVPIAGKPPSVALADHLRSLDWRGRDAKPKTKVTAQELEDIRAVAASLMNPET